MAKKFRVMLMICAALALLAGAAWAEEAAQDMQLELFTSGGLPEAQMIMLLSADDLDAYIIEQLSQQAAEIPLSSYGLTAEAFKARMTEIINDTPSLFYVDNSFIVYTNTLTGLVTRVVPGYLYSGEDLQNRIAAFDATVNRIAEYASVATTPLGQMLLINEYFCINYNYDDSLTFYGPDELFSGGTGVCQAYMLAFSAVLDELGIPNTHATSTEMVHTWNMVYMDGNWYHIDLTWNEPGANHPLLAYHDYFLLSDAGIQEAGHHDWTSTALATDTQYDDAFWQAINTPMAAAGSSIYYLESDAPDGMRTALCWDASTGETSEAFQYDIRNKDGVYGFYVGFSPMAADAERLYYAARGHLVSSGHDGSNAEPVYATGDDSLQIHSCWMNGDTIYMLVGQTPSDAQIITCDSGDRVRPEVTPRYAELASGEGLQLSAMLSIDTMLEYESNWQTTDPAIAAVDENGKVNAIASGVVLVSAGYGETGRANVLVVVDNALTLNLPAATTAIADEAFMNTAAKIIVLPDGVKNVGSRAFADSDALLAVHLPDDLTDIAADAFEGSENACILCSEGSAAEAYALLQGIDYITNAHLSE